MRSSLAICFLLLGYFLSIVKSVGMLYPTKHMRVALLGKDLRSLYTFYFKVETTTAAGNFIRVKFANYASISPLSCMIKLGQNTIWQTLPCSIIEEPDPTKPQHPYLFAELPDSIYSTSDENVLQVDLLNYNPLDYLSRNFELATVSNKTLDTEKYFSFDVNLNFGQAPWLPKSEATLSVVLLTYGTPNTNNRPGALNALDINIEIKIPVGNVNVKAARVQVVISSPWTFTDFSIVTAEQDSRYDVLPASDVKRDLYKGPVIQKYDRESPNQMTVIFDENFPVGRAFTLKITDILNPESTATGIVKVYTLNYNSNQEIQMNQGILNLNILQNPITAKLKPSNDLPLGVGPIAFFKNTKQFMVVEFSIDRKVNANSYLKLDYGAANTLIYGTAFISSNVQSNDALKPIWYSYDKNILTISNIGILEAGINYYVIARVLISSTQANIKVVVTIDSNQLATKPLYKGETQASDLKINGNSLFVDSVTPAVGIPWKGVSGSKGNVGYIDITTNDGPSQMLITLQPGLTDTSTASILEIYVSKDIKQHTSFSGSTSCKVSYPPTVGDQFFNPCKITENQNYTVITLSSPLTSNYFDPTKLSMVTIDGLLILSSSNLENNVIEMFFRLRKNQAPSSPTLDFQYDPVVMKESKDAFFLQQVNEVGKNSDYYMPSLINLVSTSILSTTSAFNFALLSDEVRAITFYAKFGLKTLVQTPVSQTAYSCGCNIPISCQYIMGDVTAPVLEDETYFLGWDRVNMWFGNEPSTSTFHVMIPDLFTRDGTIQSKTTQYKYAVAIGAYNQKTRTYRYVFHQNILKFYPLPLAVYEEMSYLKLDMKGSAGSEQSDVGLDIRTKTGHLGNMNNYYGAAVVVVSDWQLWIPSYSKYKKLMNFVSDGFNSPIACKFTDPDGNIRHITMFPLINVIEIDPVQTLLLNGVIMPFSFDLPNHVIYVTEQNGKFHVRKMYQNSGPNYFYSGALKQVDMQCNEMSDGAMNTFCSITFTPYVRIQSPCQIQLNFTGIYVNTNACDMKYQSGLSWVYIDNQSCNSSIDTTSLRVYLKDGVVYPNLVKFNISMWGIDIRNQTDKQVLVSVTDISGNFVIEKAEQLLTTQIFTPQKIYITEINYVNNNPFVYTSLIVQFTIPRGLFANENLYVNPGKDILDVNINTDRMSLKLYRSKGNEEIPIAINIRNQKLQILLTQRQVFYADSYRFQFNALRTPASNLNDNFQIQFVRTYDLAIVITNDDSTSVKSKKSIKFHNFNVFNYFFFTIRFPATIISALSLFDSSKSILLILNIKVKFPPLIEKSSSDIQMISSSYLLQGALSEIIVAINMKEDDLSYQSKIFVSFPLYYSPGIVNFQSDLYCRINRVKIPCKQSDSLPYRLEIYNSPVKVHPKQTFNITIFGIKVPQYDIKTNSIYNNETIFIALDSKGNNNFSEFIHITPPIVQSIGNSFKYLHLLFVDVNLKETRALSFHSIHVLTEIEIPLYSGINVLFPKEYSSLEVTSELYCIIQIYDATTDSFKENNRDFCQVQGRQVKIPVTKTIPKDSKLKFDIENVPTPINETTVDMNEMVIQVYQQDSQYLITRNFYLTSMMTPITFKNQKNYLKVNNDTSIIITKGTYSPLIPIETVNGTRFVANIKIEADAIGFAFQPSQFVIFLGDFKSLFRIGADKNLLEKIYSFNLRKTEKSLKPIYSVLSNIVVFVVSDPVKVDLPPSIVVPRGGCSLPYKILLTNAPYDTVNLALQYDYNIYPEEMFYMDLEISSYVSEFTSLISDRYVSFCITDKFPQNQTLLQLGLYLGGINAHSYFLSNEVVALNIIDKERTIQPQLTLSVSSLTQSNITVDIATNTDGSLFWHLYVDGSDMLPLLEIKVQVKERNLTLAQENDNLHWIYSLQLDERVGLQVVYSSNDNQLILTKLHPQLSYKLCGYFETEFKVSTIIPTCIQFNTLGYGCSMDEQPDKYYYQFNGLTFSTTSEKTNIYLIPDIQIPNDPSLNSMSALFTADSLKLRSDIIETATKDYSIDFIDYADYQTTFSFTDSIQSSNDMQTPNLTLLTVKPVSSLATAVLIVQANMSPDGTVYCIADRKKLIIMNPKQFESINITINDIQTPTVAQILNCQNSNNMTAEYCFRVHIIEKISVQFELNNAAQDSIYQFYCVTANQYPLRPIISPDQTVQIVEIRTYEKNVEQTQISLIKPLQVLFILLSILLF